MTISLHRTAAPSRSWLAVVYLIFFTFQIEQQYFPLSNTGNIYRALPGQSFCERQFPANIISADRQEEFLSSRSNENSSGYNGDNHGTFV